MSHLAAGIIHEEYAAFPADRDPLANRCRSGRREPAATLERVQRGSDGQPYA